MSTFERTGCNSHCCNSDDNLLGTSTLGEGRGGRKRRGQGSACGPRCYFDNMYFKVKNDLQTQFKYMNYFIYTSHPYIFYHLLETGKGFHIRPPDDNTGFSLNRSHRKDLKQCPSMFKSLELVHMETGYPGEVRYLSYPW